MTETSEQPQEMPGQKPEFGQVELPEAQPITDPHLREQAEHLIEHPDVISQVRSREFSMGHELKLTVSSADVTEKGQTTHWHELAFHHPGQDQLVGPRILFNQAAMRLDQQPTKKEVADFRVSLKQPQVPEVSPATAHELNSL